MLKYKNGKIREDIIEGIERELNEIDFPKEKLNDFVFANIKNTINVIISSEYFKVYYFEKCIGIGIRFVDDIINGYRIQQINIDVLVEGNTVPNIAQTTTINIYKSDEFDAQPFLDVIKLLEESNIPKQRHLTDQIFYNKLSEEQKNLIDNVECMASKYIFTSGGTVDYKAKYKLLKMGVMIFPGEKDSFGWITGCIETKKGIVVFS